MSSKLVEKAAFTLFYEKRRVAETAALMPPTRPVQFMCHKTHTQGFTRGAWLLVDATIITPKLPYRIVI